MATQLTPAIQVAPGDLTLNSTTPQVELGTYVETTDGRGFRYVLAGATALVPGKLQQSAAEATGNEDLACAAASIGATTITTTTTVTVTANQYAGGWVMVTVTPGQGYQYKIKSRPAATAAALTITLEDPILVALTTSSRIDLCASPYSGVIINPSAASGVPVGVAVYPVTAAQYGWVQTHGPCNVLADGTVTVGTTVVASNGTAGAVEAFAGVQQVVGIAITGIATTEYGSIFLTLD